MIGNKGIILQSWLNAWDVAKLTFLAATKNVNGILVAGTQDMPSGQKTFYGAGTTSATSAVKILNSDNALIASFLDSKTVILGALYLKAADNNFSIAGGGGQNAITTGAYNVNISGGQGQNAITTGALNVNISGEQGQNAITEGFYNVNISGQQGQNALTTGSRNVNISGGQGQNALTTGTYNVNISEQQGQNALTPGSQNVNI